MSNQKQFGIWMDGQHATIVGKANAEDTAYSVLAQVKRENVSSNSSEKNAQNQEKSVQTKFFKEITTHMQNATSVHVTGTGQAQEQFIHYLAETPQFKNTTTSETTSNKMSDEALVTYFNFQ